MKRETKVIAVCNQKGGVGKTTTTVNLGIGLVRNGKKVLLIDGDPQGDLTTSLGYNGDELSLTLADVMRAVISEEKSIIDQAVLNQGEGIDLIPSNLDLSAMEMTLVNTMSREQTLKRCIEEIKGNYDYILIDCMPSLGMLTVNALTASDDVIIPVQAQYLPAKGMTKLLQTVNRVRKYLNPELKIAGILMTLVDGRTNLAKEINDVIRNTYSSEIKIFDASIPTAVKAAEASARGESIFKYDSKSPASIAYDNLTKEVISGGRREKTWNKAAVTR